MRSRKSPALERDNSAGSFPDVSGNLNQVFPCHSDREPITREGKHSKEGAAVGNDGQVKRAIRHLAWSDPRVLSVAGHLFTRCARRYGYEPWNE